MDLFKNKFFVWVLVLFVVIYLLPASPVQAGGGIGGIIDDVVHVVKEVNRVVNTVVNTVVGTVEKVTGKILGITFLSEDGECRLERRSGFFGEVYAGRCEGLSPEELPPPPPPPPPPPIPQPSDFNLNLGGGGSGSVTCNSVPLSWTASSNADGYRILRGSPRVDISPYQPYTALNYSDTTVSQNTTYRYQIEAYNAAGTNRSNVLNVTTPYCPPTVDIKANGSDGPISIYQGQSVTLSWSSAYSTSMMGSMMGGISKELSASVSSLFSAASGGWGGSMPLNGSQVVVPLPPSATFTLTGSGPGGSVSDSVTINITPLALPDWREIIPR